MLKDFVVHNDIKYEWLGHSTMRITPDDGFAIYTDPVLLDKNPPVAGLILITHHHVDHCLPEFITPIRDEKTRLAAYHESYIKYCADDIKGVRTVKVGQTIELSGVRITGIEAYTARGFHMKGEGCGFLMEFRGQRIYFSGDTAPVKEMEGLKDIDTAIMAIGDNTYNIDTLDVARAVKAMKPALFIPVHFTPPDEPDPALSSEIYLSKDPRFFTRKEDPARLLPLFKDTGIEMALLRKLGG